MMCLIMEIAMFVYGIVVLVRGQLTLSQRKVVYGTPARCLAILLLAPIPLMVVTAIGVGIYIVATNPGIDPEQIQRRYQGTFVLVEVFCGLIPILLMYAIGNRYAKDPAEHDAARRTLDEIADEEDWKGRDDRPAAPNRRTSSDAISDRPFPDERPD